MTPFEDDFQTWLTSIDRELNEIFQLMRKSLHREPEELIDDLMKTEAHNARMNHMLAQANAFLDRAAFVYLPGRDEVERELERRTMLDSKISHIRELRDKIEGICSSIKQRLILGESILAYQRSYNTRSATEEKAE